MSGSSLVRSSSAKQVIAFCHEIGQYLHAYGLYASAIDKSTLPVTELAFIRQMNQSVWSIEMLVNMMQEMTNLRIGKHDQQCQDMEVEVLLRRLSKHYQNSFVAQYVQPPVWIKTDSLVLWRLLKYSVGLVLMFGDTCELNYRIVRQRLRVEMHAACTGKRPSAVLSGMTIQICRSLARLICATANIRTSDDEARLTISLPLPRLFDT